MGTLDPAELLSYADYHPYLRSTLANLTQVSGRVGGDGGVVWSGQTWYGRTGHALGPWPEGVRDHLPADLIRITVPRDTPAPPGFEVLEAWDLLWSTGPAASPVVTPVPVSDLDAVSDLLDLALPGSSVRPGNPRVVGWYGIWAGPLLVACAGDRSAVFPGAAGPPVGSLAGIAVRPGHRRRGFGAAVSAHLTNRLRATHDLVTLGVTAGNDPALRMYAALGYTGTAHLTTYQHPRRS